MKYIASFTVAACLAASASAQDWKFGDGAAPERWSLQNSNYALCDAGLSQSPIDLGTPNAVADIELETNYGETDAKLSLGSQKVQLDFPAGMGMVSGGLDFALLQVHFHSPSEHAINGERFPLVGHFVHATEDGRLGVLGIMFEEGEANTGLTAIIDALDSGNGAEVNLDIETMIPDDLSVYRYMGSLTTPPCSEGVNWHVSKDIMTASADQIEALTKILGSSARSIQPLGNRLLVAPAE